MLEQWRWLLGRLQQRECTYQQSSRQAGGQAPEGGENQVLHRPLLLTSPLLRSAGRISTRFFLATAAATVRNCCCSSTCCIGNVGLHPVKLCQCLQGVGVRGQQVTEPRGKHAYLLVEERQVQQVWESCPRDKQESTAAPVPAP